MDSSSSSEAATAAEVPTLTPSQQENNSASLSEGTAAEEAPKVTTSPQQQQQENETPAQQQQQETNESSSSSSKEAAQGAGAEASTVAPPQEEEEENTNEPSSSASSGAEATTLTSSQQQGENNDESSLAPTMTPPQKQQKKNTKSSSASTPPPRRSGRKRVSTTLEVDGHTILRKNYYTVTGMNYIYHDAPPSTDTTAAKEEKPKKKEAPPPPKQPKAKKQKTSAQVARQTHNQAVQVATHPKESLRTAFLAKHWQRLEDFVEPHVLRHLKQQLKNTATTSIEQEQETVSAAPKMVEATLRDYQIKGLQFMVNMHRQNLSMILGDEMGLGKTLQTISLLCYLKENEEITGPSLVVCPLSVLSSWCNEMTKWAPTLKYFRLHASDSEEQQRQKLELAEHATDYDVILTTYEMAKLPALLHSLYQRVHFHYLVLDEGHKIKGHLTQLAAAVRKIHKGNTLLLTGTPLQNNLVELWSLLNFLYPDIFTTMEPFEKHFDLTSQSNNNKGGIVDKTFLVKTQKLLELFMLRRLKTEVETRMPEKLETKVHCPLSKTQTFWYKALLMKDMGQLENMDKKAANGIGQTRHTLLRSLFMQLRKCCNHPFLFEGAEGDPNETSLQDLVAASGKLSVLDMLLQTLCKKGHRAVLFTQFTMVLDLLQDYCTLRGWKFCRLDGSTERARRNYLISRFNEPNSPYFLFIMSTRSGGMGLNLQTADTCILFDSDWNPQSDIQAMGRVHRIGQTKTVHVYRLVSSGTVEERMLERAEKKLLLEMVNRESKDTNLDQEEDHMARGLSADELLEDIKFGCEAIFGSSGQKELPSWDDIEAITDRARKESDSAGKLQGGASRNAKSFDAETDFTASQTFGGADFRAIREEQQQKKNQDTPKNLAGIAHLWKDIQALNKKRNRKSRIVKVDGMGSGYGSASVPVLASNNYDLLKGESSVFDRELTSSQKSNFEVKKRKKGGKKFVNQDFCQVCGEGGSIVLCPLCPCAVHLKCVGLSNPKEFLSCTHHRCVECFKNRSSAGGVLFPCQSCANSYCEDCLPEEGVTFLDSVDRFENLGFDSTKNVVYVHCSEMCDNLARVEYGYVSPETNQVQKEPLDLSYNFGASQELDEAQEQLAAEEENDLSTGVRTRGKKRSYLPAPPRSRNTDGGPKEVEKLLRNEANELEILEEFASVSAAARSINSYGSLLMHHMKNRPDDLFEGFYWRFKEQPNQIQQKSSPKGKSRNARRMLKVCPDTSVVLEEFESMSAAAKSVNSAQPLLSLHMSKKPTKLFKGFYWRFQVKPKENPSDCQPPESPAPAPISAGANNAKRIFKVCPDTSIVLEQFESMTAAAESVDAKRPYLSLHMQNTPKELFKGFYWRFELNSSQSEPVVSSAPQPTWSEEPPSSGALQPTGSDEPTLSSSLQPTGSEEPTSCSAVQPTGSEEPISSSAPQPTGSEPMSSSALEPTGNEEVTLSSALEPTGSEEVTSSSALEPTGSEEVTSRSALEPTGSKDPMSSSALEPTGIEEPISSSTLQATRSEEPLITKPSSMEIMETTMPPNPVSVSPSPTNMVLSTIDTSGDTAETAMGLSEESSDAVALSKSQSDPTSATNNTDIAMELS